MYSEGAPFSTSKRLRFWMVVVVFVVIISLIVYLLYKVRKRRADQLRELNNQVKDTHGAEAIMEERHVTMVEDTKPLREDENKFYGPVDFYMNYDSIKLWNDFELSRLDNLSNTSAQEEKSVKIDLIMYYQESSRSLRLTICSVRHLDSLCLHQRSKVRLKVILCHADDTQVIEETHSFSPYDTVTVDERFSFELESKQFAGSVLYVSLWNINVFYRAILLGAVSVDLSLYDLSSKPSITEDLIPVQQVMICTGF